MLSEAIDSFKENIKQKIANPFLGTLLLVWIVKNWKVVYAFFFFDKEHKLQNRIDYFNSYWKEHNFIWNFVGVVLLTILILVVTYLFLALSRFISSYYENVIIPQIQKWSKGKIVAAETHQIAIDRISVLESKVEVERRAKVELQNEIERLENRKLSNEDSNLPSENFSDIASRLDQNFEKDAIKAVFTDIAQNLSVKSANSIVEFLLNNALIEYKTHSAGNPGNRYYKFTTRGNEFRKEYFGKYS